MAIADSMLLDALAKQPFICGVEAVREMEERLKGEIVIFTCAKFLSVLIFNFSGSPHSSMALVGVKGAVAIRINAWRQLLRRKRQSAVSFRNHSGLNWFGERHFTNY